MRAVVLHEFGPAENLLIETLPDPEPGPGQVRITVRAAGVHAVEAAMRRGSADGLLPPLPELPTVFGGEVSGTVDALGADVDPSWLGKDVVTSHGKPGGYAELVVADVESLHIRPGTLSHEAAVAMVVTGSTTVALLDIAALRPHDVVLVNSAAGGIGRLILQHAHALGATVIGAAGGPGKTSVLEALGADLAVDYNAPGWEKTVTSWLDERGGRRVSVALDGVGGDKARAAFGLVGHGGRFLVYGTSSGEEFAPSAELLASRHVTWTAALEQMLEHPEASADAQTRALARGARGELTSHVQTFPLAEAARAHAAMERRETTGKVVLVP